MIKTYLILIFLIFQSIISFAQKLDKYIEQQQVVRYQKLYLHTDRDFYFYGDTLWFASYLVNGQTHIPTTENCNLYVELINTKGEIAQEDIFEIKNGTCPGFLSFARNDFKEGNYLLRAYTDYLKNFNSDSFFEKTITLSETKNSTQITELQDATTNSSEIDIQFFPEGGFLLSDKINLVAFKASNAKGEDVEVKGEITDENGKLICAFNSSYKGMGKFYFVPTANSACTVKIDGHPGLKPKLPEVRMYGSKLMVSNANDKLLKINILSTEEKSPAPFYVACMHRGEGTFFMKIQESQIQKTIEIKTNTFKEGINRIVLLNSNLEPLSERMVFLDSQKDINLDLKLNEKLFNPREKVTLQIDAGLASAFDMAQLSVAVINENATNAAGSTQNIKSYLLIDSELNGFISSPADFFVDEKNLPSKNKLEFLMLTNGWKNYIWNKLKKEDNKIEFVPQLGIQLCGKVLNPTNDKSLKNSKVILSVISKNEEQFFSTYPDFNGNFEFKNIRIQDTATVFIQGKDRKNKARTKLELNSTYSKPAITSDKINRLNLYAEIPLSLYRLNYFNQQTLSKFYPDYNTRVLEDIEVKAEKPETPDGHFRAYGTPSASKKVEDAYIAYENVFEFIKGRFAGVIVREISGAFPSYWIQIRGTNSISLSSEAMVLVDGVQVFDMNDVKNIPMKQIDKVDILKGPDASIYGVRGANGVVCILTKRFEQVDVNSGIVPGTIVKQIKGFAPFREFYSPKYTAENIKSEIPDVRTTLYWNPAVTTDEGIAEVSFFTCDHVSRYKIIVEGITNTGKICLGSADFEVNRNYASETKIQ